MELSETTRKLVEGVDEVGANGPFYGGLMIVRHWPTIGAELHEYLLSSISSNSMIDEVMTILESVLGPREVEIDA